MPGIDAHVADYITGKVGMSVLVKGLAVDFQRQGRDQMAITSIWPASVCSMHLDDTERAD